MDAIDIESQRLILSLLLEDVQERVLVAQIAGLDDEALASSLETAMRLDQPFIDTYTTIDRAERRDRAAAMALERGEALPPQSKSQLALEKMRFPNTETTNGSEAPVHSVPFKPILHPRKIDLVPKSFASSPLGINVRSAIEKVDCVICGDKIAANIAFDAPCEHYYCRQCLVDLVETSTKDESLFPFRCCKINFIGEDFFPFLSERLLALIKRKAIEFGTPSARRIYCPIPSCSEFVGSNLSSRSVADCPKCSTLICVKCKSTTHPGRLCAADEAQLKVQQLAKSAGWQTCPSCRAIVELSQGCYHITCRCSKEFCYLCAKPWKSCTCAQWDEDLLLSAANRQVRNQYGEDVARARPSLHLEQVARRVRELRVNHECNNHRWTLRQGGGGCNECGNHLKNYLLRCVNCQFLACVRCQRNRL